MSSVTHHSSAAEAPVDFCVVPDLSWREEIAHKFVLLSQQTHRRASGCYPEEKQLALSYTFWCNVFVDQLSAVLTAISHPSRRAIIDTLAQGPKRFTDVAEPFDLALNSITKHLKLLDRAGLIERERQGREVFISLRPEPLRLVSGWVHEYEQFWNERMDEFQQHHRNKKKKDKRRYDSF